MRVIIYKVLNNKSDLQGHSRALTNDNGPCYSIGHIYNFLLVFYNYHVSLLYRFWDIVIYLPKFK